MVKLAKRGARVHIIKLRGRPVRFLEEANVGFSKGKYMFQLLGVLGVYRSKRRRIPGHKRGDGGRTFSRILGEKRDELLKESSDKGGTRF